MFLVRGFEISDVMASAAFRHHASRLKEVNEEGQRRAVWDWAKLGEVVKSTGRVRVKRDNCGAAFRADVGCVVVHSFWCREPTVPVRAPLLSKIDFVSAVSRRTKTTHYSREI